MANDTVYVEPFTLVSLGLSKTGDQDQPKKDWAGSTSLRYSDRRPKLLRQKWTP